MYIYYRNDNIDKLFQCLGIILNTIYKLGVAKNDYFAFFFNNYYLKK